MSICSTESVSTNLKPMKCPYCTWEKQGRYLFKHIYTSHYDEIYTSVGSLSKLQNEYDKDFLPKLNQTWEEDLEEYDADEDKTTIKKIVKERNIWCCFGCSKTFFTDKSMTNHLVKEKKKAACYKEHRILLKRILVMLEHNEPKAEDPYSWIFALPIDEIRKGAERYGRGIIYMQQVLEYNKNKNRYDTKYLQDKRFNNYTPINPINLTDKILIYEAYKSNSKIAMEMLRFINEFRLVNKENQVDVPHNLCNHEEREHNNDLPEFPEN